MDIDLLLAHADGRGPMLAEGLPFEAAATTAKPNEQLEMESFPKFAEDPNSLPDQRWGIIVPEGLIGERLAQIVAPLRAARKEQQGAEPIVFKAPAGMTAEQAAAWWGDVYHSEDIKLADRPRYLLILGDADQITWEAQQRFASSAFVGRLAFANDADYEAYVHKILACERAERAKMSNPRAVFHTVRDGTAATSAGHRGLMVPTVEEATTGYKTHEFPASKILDLTERDNVSPDDFLREAQSREPTMLFSISHGLGAAKDASGEEQRRIQGAMSFGGSTKITAEDVAGRPFLPGGAWFFFACFSAGTPSESAYHHWLLALKNAGMRVRPADIEAVLATLPKNGQPPFVAALPRAALANPDGPLAVMGHVDLAWTFSFQDVGGSNKYKPARFQEVFRAIVDHKRIGCGYSDLQRTYTDANTDLTIMFDKEERMRARNEPIPQDKAREMKKGSLWMLRQDLTAYVLLGDPAARVTASPSPDEMRKAPAIAELGTSGTTDAKTTPATNTDTPATFGDTPNGSIHALSKLDPARIEAAVFANVGSEALDALATHFGVSRADLDAWIHAYREGGRAAVKASSSV